MKHGTRVDDEPRFLWSREREIDPWASLSPYFTKAKVKKEGISIMTDKEGQTFAEIHSESPIRR